MAAQQKRKKITFNDMVLVTSQADKEFESDTYYISIRELYELFATQFAAIGSGGGSTLDNVELREGGN